MPMHKVVYDKELKDTQEWKNLYNRWRKIKSLSISPEFTTFEPFYRWSMKNGYSIGAHLVLIDSTKPYGPDNCEWIGITDYSILRGEEREDFCKKWNVAVNRIRKHFGMKPLPGTTHSSGQT